MNFNNLFLSKQDNENIKNYISSPNINKSLLSSKLTKTKLPFTHALVISGWNPTTKDEVIALYKEKDKSGNTSAHLFASIHGLSRVLKDNPITNTVLTDNKGISVLDVAKEREKAQFNILHKLSIGDNDLNLNSYIELVLDPKTHYLPEYLKEKMGLTNITIQESLITLFPEHDHDINISNKEDQYITIIKNRGIHTLQLESIQDKPKLALMIINAIQYNPIEVNKTLKIHNILQDKEIYELAIEQVNPADMELNEKIIVSLATDLCKNLSQVTNKTLKNLLNQNKQPNQKKNNTNVNI